MRVLVELLDKEPIENVLGSCIFEPEIVVYLCDERFAFMVKESAIYRLFRTRGLRTKPRFLYFDASRPESILTVLQAVAQDYPGCIFDFTGGRDLVLALAGAFCEANSIPGYYIDQFSGRFITLRGCEHLESRFSMPRFTAGEVLALAGATIGGHGHFDQGQIDEAFEADIRGVWALVNRNPKAWGEFVSLLQAWCSQSPPASLSAGGPRVLAGGAGKLRCNTAILDNLLACGVLAGATVSDKRVRLQFKSLLHKKCLLNNGIWLELFTYIEARKTGFFDDVRTSMVIDWRGVDGGADNTKNEVDVFAVHGVTPVFISCKMSVPSPLALAEIMLLARRFGGMHARPVVVTAARLNGSHKALQLRAQDMGVELLGAELMQNGGLGEKLAAIGGGRGTRLLRPEDE